MQCRGTPFTVLIPLDNIPSILLEGTHFLDLAASRGNDVAALRGGGLDPALVGCLDEHPGFRAGVVAAPGPADAFERIGGGRRCSA